MSVIIGTKRVYDITCLYWFYHSIHSSTKIPLKFSSKFTSKLAIKVSSDFTPQVSFTLDSFLSYLSYNLSLSSENPVKFSFELGFHFSFKRLSMDNCSVLTVNWPLYTLLCHVTPNHIITE